MKYVKTFRVHLNPNTYPASVLDLPRTRDFHQSYPAPVLFTIPTNIYKISAEQMSLLALWFNRGTTLQHNGVSITFPNPKQGWGYQFTSVYPKHYQLTGKTTAQQCYEYGQLLIKACNDHSKISFANLEMSYKMIMKAFWNSPTVFFSPNKKTYLEVKSEMETLNELKAVSYCTSNSINSDINDTELDLFCRIFGVSNPDWAIKARPTKTDHGFAMIQELAMTSNFTVPKVEKTADGSIKPGYAGLDEQTIIPTTLSRDAQPRPINNRYLRAQLVEQINWFRKTFDETHDTNLLAEGWGHCDTCGYFQTNEGCSCGNNPSAEQQELETIREAQEFLQTSSKHHDCEIQQLSEKMKDLLGDTIMSMTYDEIIFTAKLLNATLR